MTCPRWPPPPCEHRSPPPFHPHPAAQPLRSDSRDHSQCGAHRPLERLAGAAAGPRWTHCTPRAGSLLRTARRGRRCRARCTGRRARPSRLAADPCRSSTGARPPDPPSCSSPAGTAGLCGRPEREGPPTQCHTQCHRQCHRGQRYVHGQGCALASALYTAQVGGPVTGRSTAATHHTTRATGARSLP